MTIVRRRARTRLEQIDRELPELVDLLVVSVESGLGFSSSMKLAAERLKGPLGDEMRLAMQEQTMGLPTDQVLANILTRSDTPAMRSFVRSVRQGESLGVSIGQILRNLAVEMRKRRRGGGRGAGPEGADQDPLPARPADLPGALRRAARAGDVQARRRDRRRLMSPQLRATGIQPSLPNRPAPPGGGLLMPLVPPRAQRRSLPLEHRMLRFLAALVLAVAVMTISQSAVAEGARRPSAPRQISPGDRSVQPTVPAFSWARVKRAATYEFQLSADRRFKSIVLGERRGSFKTRNTFATIDGTLAEGRYFWRVRAITTAGKSGRWSRVRSMAKALLPAPTLLGPAHETVGSGADALVLRWAPVEGAYKYLVTVGKDDSLAQVVIGARDGGVMTSGTAFAPSARLAPGSYSWAVTALDPGGHRGRQSDPAPFTWSRWQSDTTTGVRDASDNWPNFDPASPLFDAFSPFFGPEARRLGADASGAPRVLDPQLYWRPIPGASSYEVEVNHSGDFAVGSKMCCKQAVSETSIFPPNVLANNRYHWRVRALDSDGNAGDWNVGSAFQKDFDLLENATGARLPSVRNLRLVHHASDPAGSGLTGAPVAQIPIVAWDPVVGAASYEVQVMPQTSVGCNWTSAAGFDVVTAATAWTPLSPFWNTRRPGGISYTRVGKDLPALSSGVAYCVRVLAQSDRDADRGAVVSDWTQLGVQGQAAFEYQAMTPTAPSTLRAAGGSDYLTPRSVNGAWKCSPDPGRAAPPVGSPEAHDCTRLPLFTWKPIPGARSYFVVVAKDASFTEIIDLAITQVPAYAPRSSGRSRGHIPTIRRRITGRRCPPLIPTATTPRTRRWRTRRSPSPSVPVLRFSGRRRLRQAAPRYHRFSGSPRSAGRRPRGRGPTRSRSQPTRRRAPGRERSHRQHRVHQHLDLPCGRRAPLARSRERRDQAGPALVRGGQIPARTDDPGPGRRQPRRRRRDSRAHMGAG